MQRSCPVLVAALMALSLTAVLAPSASAKPAAGPQIIDCGKFEGKAGKLRACKAQNQANRIAFNQIKNSLFVGERGDGAEVEATFCANGSFETRVTNSYGTGVSEDSRWTVGGARVKQGGKWIDALIRAPEGFEIGLQRRGSQWKYGISSFDRILEPGNVDKENAAAACRAGLG